MHTQIVNAHSYFKMKHYAGFVRVLENLESAWIWLDYFQGFESAWIF